MKYAIPRKVRIDYVSPEVPKPLWAADSIITSDNISIVHVCPKSDGYLFIFEIEDRMANVGCTYCQQECPDLVKLAQMLGVKG
jgi:flavin-dependent dehydrogenase